MNHVRLFLLPLFLLLACSGQQGVLVDIGSWPAGAVALQVTGRLNGHMAVSPLSYSQPESRFVVYLQPEDSGELELSISAIDAQDCTIQRTTAQLAIGGGYPFLRELRVELQPVQPLQCPAPIIERVTPAAASTLGGGMVRIFGQHFRPDATLQLGSVSASDVLTLSPAELTAVVPRNLGAFGPVPIVLRNPDGRSARRDDLFAYYASQVAFAGARTLATDRYTTMVQAVDVNHDGALDLITSNGINSISVLMGDGKGGFTAHQDTPTGPNPTSLALADFNADQNVDLAVSTFGSNSVEIYVGDGKGGFSALDKLPSISWPGRPTASDVNADGVPDLLVTASLTNEVWVFLGNRRAGFQAPRIAAVGAEPSMVAVGDWNGDGHLDLVTSNHGAGGVTLLYGDGSGAFGNAQHIATDRGPFAVAAADMNRDGALDLVVCHSDAGVISVLLGTGQGSFAAPQSVTNLASPSALTIVDLDGDQVPDVAVAETGANRVRVLLNDGRGGLGTASLLPVADNPRSIAVGDFNRDGKPDLVTSNYAADSVSVLLNDCM